MGEPIRIVPLAGGLNDGVSPVLLEASEAAEVDRCSFEDGSIRAYGEGFVKLSRHPPSRGSLRFGSTKKVSAIGQSDGWLFAPAHAAYSGLASHTLEAKVFLDEEVADNEIQGVFGFGNNFGSGDRITYYVKRASGSPHAFFGVEKNGTEFNDTSRRIFHRRPYHVAWRYDGANVQILVEGIQVFSAAGSIGRASGFYAHPWFGGFDPGGGFGTKRWKGRIEEVRLWNFARATADILAEKDRLVDPASPGLIGLWRMHDGIGRRVEDLSVNRNDAYFANGVLSTVRREGLTRGAAWTDGVTSAFELDFRTQDTWEQWRYSWVTGVERWKVSAGITPGRLPAPGAANAILFDSAPGMGSGHFRLELQGDGRLVGKFHDGSSEHTITAGAGTGLTVGRRHLVSLRRVSASTWDLLVGASVVGTDATLASINLYSSVPTHVRFGAGFAGGTIDGPILNPALMALDEVRVSFDSVVDSPEGKVKESEILLSLGPQSVQVARNSPTVNPGSGEEGFLAACARNLLVVDDLEVVRGIDENLDGKLDSFARARRLYRIFSQAATLFLNTPYDGPDAALAARFTRYLALHSLEDPEKERLPLVGQPETVSSNTVAVTREVYENRAPAGIGLHFVHRAFGLRPSPPEFFAPRWAAGIDPIEKTPIDALASYEKTDGSRFTMVGAHAGLRRFDDRWRRKSPFDAVSYPSARSIAFEDLLDRVRVIRPSGRLDLTPGGSETIEAWIEIEDLSGKRTIWCLADPEDPKKINGHWFITEDAEMVLKWGDGTNTRSVRSIPGAVPRGTLLHVAVVKTGLSAIFKIGGKEFSATVSDTGTNTTPWPASAADLWIGNCPSSQLADGGVLRGAMANPRMSKSAVYPSGDISPPTAPLSGGDGCWPFEEGEDVFVRELSSSALPGEIESPPYVSVLEGIGRQGESPPNGVTYADRFYWTNGKGPPVFFDGKGAAEVGLIAPAGKLRVSKKGHALWSDSVRAYASAPEELKRNFSLRFEGLTYLDIPKGNSSGFAAKHERDEGASSPTAITTVSMKGYIRPSTRRIADNRGRRVLLSHRDAVRSVNYQLSIFGRFLEFRWWDTKQKLFVTARITSSTVGEEFWNYFYVAYRFGDPDGADEAAGGGAPYKGPVMYLFNETTIPTGGAFPPRPTVTVVEGTIPATATNKDSPAALDTTLRFGGDGFEEIDPEQEPFIGHAQDLHVHVASNSDACTLDVFSGALKELDRRLGTWTNLGGTGAGNALGVYRFNEGDGLKLANKTPAGSPYGEASVVYRKPLAAVPGSYRFAAAFKDPDDPDRTVSSLSPETVLKVPAVGEGEEEAYNWFEVGAVPISGDIHRKKVHTILYRSGVDGSSLSKFAELEIEGDETVSSDANDQDLAKLFSLDPEKTASALTGRPPVARFLAVGEEHLFLGGILDAPAVVQYSEPFRPQEWPGTNQLFLESPDGSPVTALAHVFGRLVNGKRDSIFSVGLLGAGFGSIARIDSEVGILAHGSVVNVRGALFFLTERGPYRFNGEMLDFLGIKIEGTLEEVDVESIPNAHGALWLERQEVVFLLRRRGRRHADLLLGMNVRWPHEPWRRAVGPELTAIAAIDDAVDRPRLLGASPYGLIVRLGEGDLDGARLAMGYGPLTAKVGPGATTTTIPVTGASLATMGRGHYATPVRIGEERSVILSNTASEIRLDPDFALAAAPLPGADVRIGAFKRRWGSAVFQFGSVRRKKTRYFRGRFRAESGYLNVIFRPDFGAHPDEQIELDLSHGHTVAPLLLPDGAKRAQALQVFFEREGPFEILEMALDPEEVDPRA